MTTAAWDALPQGIRRVARTTAIGDVPCLLIPAESSTPHRKAPLLVWMHGRTANKELDPGRYLRVMRSGINICAVDLPGHGERYEDDMDAPARVVDIVLQMSAEIDTVTLGALDALQADAGNVAIGGMSAGGMAAIHRLCSVHQFKAAVLEATTGDWSNLASWSHLDDAARTRATQADPMRQIATWRPIPVCAVHSRGDQWIPFAGQQRFFEQLRMRGGDIHLHAFQDTGAPHEHVGFGRYAAQVKELERDFLARTLGVENMVS